jgi:uncharacterized membrane protein (UPF0127 family)
MKAVNCTRQIVLSENLETANRFFKRFIGLMGRKRINPGGGLLIAPCSSIHMFFMRFPIDAVFIGSDGRVVYLEKQIQPWRVSRVVWKARSVLELPAGTIDRTGTEVGDLIEIIPSPPY